MSWLDKVQQDYTITCGDGTSYTVSWLNASKGIEYNIATFEFKELAGTLVYRGTPRGTKYVLEIYFQGDDHLDVSSSFEVSAANPAPWTISHPYYGQLYVQPVSMTYDNAEYNVTKIIANVIETLLSDGNIVTISAPDKITNDKANCDTLFANTFATDVPNPKAGDINSMTNNVNGFFNTIKSSIISSDDFATYFNAYNSALAAIDDATDNVLNAVAVMQALISLPATFVDSVVNRVQMLGNLLNFIGSTIVNVSSPSSKKLYENNAGTIITTLLMASVTNITDDYANTTQVISVIDSLVGYYNTYVTSLDGLQTVNGGSPDSYIPDPDALNALSQLLSYTVSALLDIAASSKQQRITYLDNDTNVILVANSIYGLLPDDSTIDKIVNDNGIGLNEKLLLRKGRQIIYYV